MTAKARTVADLHEAARELRRTLRTAGVAHKTDLHTELVAVTAELHERTTTDAIAEVMVVAKVAFVGPDLRLAQGWLRSETQSAGEWDRLPAWVQMMVETFEKAEGAR